MVDWTILLALALILASSGAHATWNLLLKRAQSQEVFVWWLSAAGAIGALPVAVALWLTTEFQAVGLWYVAGSIVIHIWYFLFLSRALSQGDLSLVYPIARGSGVSLASIFAILTLGETVSLLAGLGIASIVFGIFCAAWWGNLSHLKRIIAAPRAELARDGIMYALLTGVCISLYSLIDKHGVAYVSPFLYLHLMTCGVAMGLAPYVIRNHGFAAIAAEWRASPGAIVAAAGLLYLAYGLILTALRLADLSYVAPAREVGLLFGVVLGVLVLKESVSAGRIAGSSLIVAGLVLITLFP